MSVIVRFFFLSTFSLATTLAIAAPAKPKDLRLLCSVEKDMNTGPINYKALDISILRDLPPGIDSVIGAGTFAVETPQGYEAEVWVKVAAFQGIHVELTLQNATTEAKASSAGIARAVDEWDEDHSFNQEFKSTLTEKNLPVVSLSCRLVPVF